MVELFLCVVIACVLWLYQQKFKDVNNAINILHKQINYLYKVNDDMAEKSNKNKVIKLRK